jgi:uncharacterized protein (DUF58 family)
MEQKQDCESHLRLNAWLLPVLVVLLLVAQLLAPYKGWFALLIGLGGALLIGFLWARSLTRNLRLTREMRYGWAQVGDQLAERFTLVNAGHFPALWVEVVDHSTVPGYHIGWATGVGADSSVRRHREAVCNRRGLFTLGPTTMLTSDPFGIFSVSIHYPTMLPFMVLPPVVPLPAIQVSPGGRAGEGRPRPNAPDRTVSASGVRDYVPGDSMRWVHWPTSARQSALFVRLFDGTPASDWWIFLDLERRVQVGEEQDSTEEHGVILAASLADRGLRLRRAVGLAVHGQELVWLPPQGGDNHRLELLRALALVSPGTCSLAELLTRTKSSLGQHASLIIVTPALGSEWVEALVPLLRRGAVPTVLLLDPVSFGGKGDARETAALLADLKVAHYVVGRELLDQPEVRPDQQARQEWRITATGRAIPIRRHDMAWKVIS